MFPYFTWIFPFSSVFTKQLVSEVCVVCQRYIKGNLDIISSDGCVLACHVFLPIVIKCHHFKVSDKASEAFSHRVFYGVSCLLPGKVKRSFL